MFRNILLLLILISCTERQEQEEITPLKYSKKSVEYKQVPNINSNLLTLDVYYDTKDKHPKPVVIWVHGGAWCVGDKINKLTDKKRFFASQAYIFVSINYRLSPYPYEIDNPDRIKFPIHNIDVADAIAWVYQNIENYGGNPDKIVLMGHSAGAQIVALTGSNHEFLQQAGVPVSAIKGVIAVDTRMYDVYDIIQNRPAFDMYLNAFGNDLQDNLNASSNRHLNSTDYFPRFLIIKRGDNERMADADVFINALLQNLIEVETLEANPYTHSQVNDAIGKPNENIVTPVIKNFITECFE